MATAAYVGPDGVVGRATAGTRTVVAVMGSAAAILTVMAPEELVWREERFVRSDDELVMRKTA
jgi:hypothetical protein